MRRVGNVIAFYSYRDFMSNHYLCTFKVKGITFGCMEQMIMYTKARCFGDLMIAQAILDEPRPQAQKLLGRKVTPYIDSVWSAKRPGWVLQGMIARYEQNPDDLQKLLDTGTTLLAEASERDTLWGVGLAEDDDRIGNPYEWLGRNLCGDLNMQAREHFRARIHQG